MPTTPLSNPFSSGSQYLHLIAGLFVATLLISNTVATKPFQVGPFILPGGFVVFPLSYIFGDVLTEVYGYARCRQVIWTGFIASGLMILTYSLVIALPAPAFWIHQNAFASSLGQVPRVVFASLLAYLAGEFVNSFALARIKISTGGRHLWARILGSTLVGQAVDTYLFIVLAFFRVWPLNVLLRTATTLYCFKVIYEVAVMPLTYAIVAFLKRKEQTDHFDIGTQFSPFRWRVVAKP